MKEGLAIDPFAELAELQRSEIVSYDNRVKAATQSVQLPLSKTALADSLLRAMEAEAKRTPMQRWWSWLKDAPPLRRREARKLLAKIQKGRKEK